MDENSVKCPFCGSETIVKYGRTQTGRQRYRCLNKSCEVKTFQRDYINNGVLKRFLPLPSFLSPPKVMSASPFYL